MDKKQLESYLISKGWRQERNGIYEKEPIPLRRLKLLKTSIRFEVWAPGSKWLKHATVYYRDMEVDMETGKLCKEMGL